MSATTLSEKFSALLTRLNQHILGQPHLTERMLVALLADGHLLVEGPPGLAKTKAIKTLSELIEGDYHRIQFTPDLLPSDITGTEVLQPNGEFGLQKGPIFHNLILADEINRAPAKVQSALLEAMAEEQVTVGKHTLPLERLFMVMATQNPIEQEGTYPLPEAQLDRFMLHVRIDYPNAETERHILDLVEDEARENAAGFPYFEPLSQVDLFEARNEILNLYLSEETKTYIVELVMATRQLEKYDPTLAKAIEFGVSPRATLALSRGARALAWLKGQDYVSPEEVQAVVHDVFRHRILLSFEGEAAGMTADKLVDQLIQLVPVI
ncbi:AAA family ATPase [Hydrogenovibrio marinus]|uniref:ATPase AAA n=1 Tax=Hydrogenovibrio marinus TaxID=28885 RepID=A0A067A082_HYDMR|nr:MoxR family ATPase [Hydrogenovibrio marinus]KDN96021.1 ATPase AAA [Hydrogenovibrio marinus]BBN58482.1 ATPase AAA [Hydrogenovibrio marinus]